MRKPKRPTRTSLKTSSAGQQKSRFGFLTVGQTARILGMSPSTLRLWENVGLIVPARTNGRFRLYSQELLKLLKRIKYLRDVKRLNVPGIKQALGKSLETRPTSNGVPQQELANKLRKLRERSGLTIAEAARRAKISTGFLSAVELSRANASVATLQRLTAAYDTTVLEFFDLPRHSGRVVRPQEHRVLQTGSGVRMEVLSIGSKMLESMLFRVSPGAGSDGSYAHQGEEFIYMLSGNLEIWLDEIEYHLLHKGDSFWFASSRGHRWTNPSDEEAVLLWVNTPPTF